MKHCISFFYALLLSFLLAACTGRKQNMLSLFASIDKAEIFKLDIETDSIRNPYLMECAEGKLFFANMNYSSLISVFDLSSGKHAGDFLTRGEGPEEALFVSNLAGCGGKLSVFDSDKQKVVFYHITKDSLAKSSCIELQNDTSFLFSTFNCLPLDAGRIAATGLTKEHRIVLLDGHGVPYQAFGDYPGARAKASGVENGFAYQGFMAYQPDKEVLAIGSSFGESVLFYDLRKVETPALLKEHTCAVPQYRNTSDKQSQSVAFGQDNIMGFLSLKASDQYCIGLYNGQKRVGMEYGGDKLLLFDWNGSPVKCLQLDQTYEQMAYDEQGNRVILLGLDKVTGEYKVMAVQI